MKSAWGFEQIGGFPEDIERLGSRLSIELGCPIKFPGFEKNTFVCRHEMVIPVFRLKVDEGWTFVKREHEEWLKNESWKELGYLL